MKAFKSIKKMITNTPIIEIKCKFNDKIQKIFVKCEWFSLTGSIKDKVAYQIYFDAYKNGLLKKGDEVVEVSSGNMGISICAMGNLLGNPVTIIMPKNVSEERKKLIKLYGAKYIETEDFKEAFKQAQIYVKNGCFCTNQFENKSNIKIQKNVTAKEIYEKIKDEDVQCFVSGVGTGGTLCGIGSFLKQKKGLKIVAIEPAHARILSDVKPFGHHKIQGISDEIVPKLYDPNLVSQIIPIADDDAIAMSQKLCRFLSLGVGISSGANFLGAILTGKNAVTVFADDNKKYLSTDLTKSVTSSLVDEIELLDFKVL